MKYAVTVEDDEGKGYIVNIGYRRCGKLHGTLGAEADAMEFADRAEAEAVAAELGGCVVEVEGATP